MRTMRDPNQIQQRAADPKTSVWVAASAGSGKTKVLTDRVLALLVDGADPASLLCVTFTKAAAAEMSNRIHRELSRWTQKNNAALDQAISALDGTPSTPQKREIARKLFARVLDLPGGLRIRTIHSFCQSILGRFPIEAGIVPNFDAMDERESAELMAWAQEAVLSRAREDSVLSDALASVTGHAVESRFADLLAGMARRRAWLSQTIRQTGSEEGAVQAMRVALGLAPEEDQDERVAIREACMVEADHEAALRAAVAAIEDYGSSREKGKAASVKAWLALTPNERIAEFDSYFGFFFTKTFTPVKTLCTNAVIKNAPMVLKTLAAEQQRLEEIDEKIRQRATAKASEGLLRLGAAILAEYEARKTAMARLDYDDLIQRAGALLSRDTVPWVLYKLDGGLEHMLIDEAQDTSPDQRTIVDALVDAFFAEGVPTKHPRTVFVVGDAKQSIYSFQGADPEGYRRWREDLTARAEAGGQELRPVPMDISFRSVQPVLDVVDATFAEGQARIGVAEPDGPAPEHIAFRENLPGRVELWPPVLPPEEGTADPFDPPILAGREDRRDATQTLAEGLAEIVAGWIHTGLTMPARPNRKIRAGDILFLVQRRTALIDALVRAFKQRGIPVAGVDRITLTEQIAVMDLIALARALLLPEDDYTLACLLKSPLVGFDDDDLIALTAPVEGQRDGLRHRLREMGQEQPRFAAASQWFDGLLNVADRIPPYELFQRALLTPCPGPGGPHAPAQEMTGRQAMVARLGTEIEDPLEEFLSLALDHDRRRTPSLEGFLAWFERGNTELKRDLEAEARDEIRIMTVHGAKGLQAPIVILPDALTKSGARGEPLRWYKNKAGLHVPIWTPSTRYQEKRAADLKQVENDAADQEYRRLLYVAMTRAEDWLIVTGRAQKRARPDGTWHQLVGEGLRRLSATLEEERALADGWQGSVLTYTPLPALPAACAEAEQEHPVSEAPAWLFKPPIPEPTPSHPLTPSRPDDAEPAARSPLAGDDPLRFKRGQLIHRLLQTLPDLAPNMRQEAAARYLALSAHGLTPDQQAQLSKEAIGVLMHPEFAALFGPGSRAEVPLVGVVGKDGGAVKTIAGQVDRLLITDHEILVVDYKTLRVSPPDPSKVPKAYIQQMAGYHAVLERLFPNRPIRCALIFTQTPRLVALPNAILIEAMQRSAS